MKYYYLINNKIMKADNDMPLETNYNDYDLTMYYLDYKQWHQSLQPCSITDGELTKVSNQVLTKFNKDKPIEVTDIIADYGCDHDGVWREKLMFKSPNKVEDNEVVESQDEIIEDMLNTFYVENDKNIGLWSDKKRLILEYNNWIKEK